MHLPSISQTLGFLFAAALLPFGALAAAMPDETLTGHKETVLAVAFSPDAKLLASASDDGSLKIWDVAAKKELFSLDGIQSNQNQIRFTPDGKTIVTLGTSNNVLVVDVATGKQKKTIPISDLPGGPAAMDLSPDGKTIAVVGRGGLRLFDLATGNSTGSYDVHPLYGVSGVAFSPDGHQIATAAADDTSLLIDAATGKVIRSFPLPLKGEGVAFSADAKRLFVRTSDQVLSSFDVASGDALKLIDQNVPILSMFVSTDGKTLAVAGTGRAPWLISLPDGKIASDLFDCDQRVMSAALSPDGKWLAGGANEGTVYLWKLGGE